MSASMKECLQLQLLEMEMLFSMFPNQGEVKLEDVNVLTNIKRYLEGTREALPPKIEFVITLQIEEPKVQIDLQVTMPHSYPYAALQLFGRSSELDRQQQLLLNKGLTSYLGTFDPGELCVCAAIQWLQDNSASYFLNRKLVYEPSTQAKPVKNTFLRMWIYSHHIYQQDLRKKILEVGKRLEVTGFCMTGKPGIICVEGFKDHCEEFWHTIRYPNWKHISCKHTESTETEGSGEDLRLFHSFEELLLEAHGDYGLRNDYHMNLGQFLEFLKKHKSEHVFQILFGIESKSSDS
ncbi:RWD domain-containing protein 2A isoform X1 [Camelus dromedarius]|uniref:RWD domain-containing protein n=3 Tax=Camelus TaxID=9836 RepID=A0A8B8TDV7_CAMFR|nr:RWD domain-containing protein 2A [Camelus bactrianus]XP_010978579.1 RWD domain-containing protein 2A isoform X1 [Camelus dromedarius]XP_014406795.1 RWD domain-containing protein 2A isoform X1 [Camelus ferus]XP_031311849.1 RWD domain-containing protein 2A isoform X1 [Camelus dromedarius]XP_032340416.1 RWD domain-containing protein 2A isoform X1 [Camelus ferus]